MFINILWHVYVYINYNFTLQKSGGCFQKVLLTVCLLPKQLESLQKSCFVEGMLLFKPYFS